MDVTTEVPSYTMTLDYEDVSLAIMKQALEGVMFHNFKVDFYDVLELNGFKAMHLCQYEEESKNLEKLKHNYISCYKKVPMINIDNQHYWTKFSSVVFSELKENDISTLVKDSLKDYADWETTALKNLLDWKQHVKDKSEINQMINGIMQEIERIETLMSILEEHDYNYDCVCELSSYLEHK